MSAVRLSLPTGRAFGYAARLVIDTIRVRVSEARATLPLEVYLSLAAGSNGVHLVGHPNSFKEGWGLMGVAVSQQTFGLILLVQSIAWAAAIFRGGVEGRERLATSHFFIMGVAWWMISTSNGDSPTLPNIVLAMLSDAWIVGAAEWAKVRRREPVGRA